MVGMEGSGFFIHLVYSVVEFDSCRFGVTVPFFLAAAPFSIRWNSFPEWVPIRGGMVSWGLGLEFGPIGVGVVVLLSIYGLHRK